MKIDLVLGSVMAAASIVGAVATGLTMHNAGFSLLLCLVAMPVAGWLSSLLVATIFGGVGYLGYMLFSRKGLTSCKSVLQCTHVSKRAAQARAAVIEGT